MAIFYFLDLECEPRRQVGGDELAAKFQAFVLCEQIVEQLRAAHGPELSETQMRFRRVIERPDGTKQEEQLDVAALRRQTAVLETLAHHCAGCPASLRGNAFGCIQSLTLPIDAATEEWLLTLVPPAEKLVGTMFRQAAQRLELGTCDLLLTWREGAFLKSGECFRTDEPTDDIPAATTDQLLHAMLMSGDLSPAQTLALLLYTDCLGLVDGGDGDDVLRRIKEIQYGTSEEAGLNLEFKRPPLATDEPAVQEFKMFLFAAFRAFSLGIPLAVRMDV